MTAEFTPMPVKTLFKVTANGRAVLITRTGRRMHRRHINFADDHAALDWCLRRQATLILLPADVCKLN
jgi:hypothetical protein